MKKKKSEFGKYPDYQSYFNAKFGEDAFGRKIRKKKK